MPHSPGRPAAPDRTALLSVTALPATRPGRVVVEVAGEVDAYTAPLLDACLSTQTRRRGVSELTVDMERVTFLGAAGVSVLARVQRRCRVRGARLVVVRGGRRSVQRPIRLCGLTDVLPAEPGAAERPGSGVVHTGSPSRAPVRRTAARRRREPCR
ncbi:anti-anti-sigma factor [Geodermatophilus bullaregiensis]|uniref:STAS domain-containing protein n=1 Tax=Geodermatophilus bullaregiensis TaxID=1564160 RepID=UPI001956E3AB|nr:STAS domain-containing protein [Geodermatophilus bullaregiensis]MBM7808243.1 anti-anti-sigma factor [Geodermatophilus bullaregiensis]